MRRSFSRTLNGLSALVPSPTFVAAMVRLLLGRRRRSSTRRRARSSTWLAAELMEGRRVLVYATHTDTKDIAGRMDDTLTRNPFRVRVTKSDAVAPDNRAAWVEAKVKQGIDVLIGHPRLVQKSLDLIETSSPFISTR